MTEASIWLYLKVWGEVLVGFILIGFIQLILVKCQNQEVSVVGLTPHHQFWILKHSVRKISKCCKATVLQSV